MLLPARLRHRGGRVRVRNWADTTGWMGTEEDREHLERFHLTLYCVARPKVSKILINDIGGSKRWDEDGVLHQERGGASFAQRCPRPPAVIITGLAKRPDGEGPGVSDDVRLLRPAADVADRLLHVRYPDDHDRYTRSDWDRWLREVNQEADAWVFDDQRWTAAQLVVDDIPYDGVATEMDSNYSTGAFHLPRDGSTSQSNTSRPVASGLNSMIWKS